MLDTTSAPRYEAPGTWARSYALTEQRGPAAAIALLVALAIAVFYVAAAWRVFTKAGRPGWAVLVPVYNMVVLLRIVGLSGWWVLAWLGPFVAWVVAVVVSVYLARSFGKGLGFGLGLAFLGFIFLPVLAFGEAATWARRPARPSSRPRPCPRSAERRAWASGTVPEP
jgi:hypothetical protein